MKSKLAAMDFYDWFGWFGNVFFILGAWMFADKHILWGFVCNMVGNVPYIVMGIKDRRTSMWVLSMALFGLNIYGIFKL